MKIIMGILKPATGSVTLCDGGTEYQCNADVRSCFAYVPQGNMIMSGTVRENITFFDTDISDEKITRAAQDACIYDYISGLPMGFDTKLGEGGSGMSEGQIQRLAIARALCCGAQVILLDEATSALDEETEHAVLSNIKRRGNTCIIISHKKCAFDLCDFTVHLGGENT